jgi:hypothetical protein
VFTISQYSLKRQPSRSIPPHVDIDVIREYGEDRFLSELAGELRSRS